MSKKWVIYNGVKMSADWPAKIEAAQLLTHYTIAGRKLPRIRFGDEDPRWGQKPCLDCGVLEGWFHVPDCEYEKCPACGQVRAGGCTCDIEELRDLEDEPTRTHAPSRVNRWIIVGLGCFLVVLLVLTVWTVLTLER